MHFRLANSISRFILCSLFLLASSRSHEVDWFTTRGKRALEASVLETINSTPTLIILSAGDDQNTEIELLSTLTVPSDNPELINSINMLASSINQGAQSQRNSSTATVPSSSISLESSTLVNTADQGASFSNTKTIINAIFVQTIDETKTVPTTLTQTLAGSPITITSNVIEVVTTVNTQMFTFDPDSGINSNLAMSNSNGLVTTTTNTIIASPLNAECSVSTKTEILTTTVTVNQIITTSIFAANIPQIVPQMTLPSTPLEQSNVSSSFTQNAIQLADDSNSEITTIETQSIEINDIMPASEPIIQNEFSTQQNPTLSSPTPATNTGNNITEEPVVTLTILSTVEDTKSIDFTSLISLFISKSPTSMTISPTSTVTSVTTRSVS
ncbi:hypothetical protein BB560_004954 [Smittium megazygosporum]|uniref:Uncharacterized protein n=1 Tax=Smittium megazygosporum TaxID=133381 RepID=A0A2T9Z7S4_9FUNG|nr:hypothetical protein BB560_004954 [Smittium megazygosporum]